MKAYPTSQLGAILRRSQDPVEMSPEETYKQVTVRLFHKGVVLRCLQQGGAIASRQWRVRSGQVLLSRIDARNGAIGLVPKELDGAIVTNDFWAFNVDMKLADPQFLDLYFGTRQFVEDCNRASEGTTNRVRVQPDRFLEIEVPLPSLPEQRRIVARIEELSAKIEEARKLRYTNAGELASLTRHLIKDAFPNPVKTRIRDFVNFQTGYAFKSEWFTEQGVRLARNVNVGHGHLDWSDTARIPHDQAKEFERFRLSEGDILITLDRPIISTGVKVARVRDEDLPCLLLQRVARAQLVDKSLLPEYLFRWLRSPHFIDAIDPGRSNGVPHISHKDIEKIPFAPPSLTEQCRIVAYLNDLQARVDTVKKLQEESEQELNALMPSILSRAFAGEL